MIKTEILFPEICSLYGDNGNIEYLRLSMPEAKFITDDFLSEPYFVKNTPDIIYIGSMSEANQRKVINKLLPYKQRICSLIDSGVIMLATGSAADIFCKNISYITEKIETEALGIFDASVKTDYFDRWNGKLLGKFCDIPVTAFRSQFSQIYADNCENYFIKVERGSGISRESKYEGFRRNNFFCTSLIGPFLPLNPLFCEYFFSLTGEKIKPAYFDTAMECFDERLREMSDKSTKFGYNI